MIYSGHQGDMVFKFLLQTKRTENREVIQSHREAERVKFDCDGTKHEGSVCDFDRDLL